MHIGIQRNTIGSQRLHLSQRALKRLRRLQRQAVNNVDIDGVDSGPAGGIHEGKDLSCFLNAMYRLLYRCIKILHTQIQAVKAHVSQRGKSIGIDDPRIKLNRVFAALRKIKVAAKHAHQRPQVVVSEKRRRTTPQMQLAHRLPRAETGRVQVHLAAEIAQVKLRPLRIFCNYFVARTEVAERPTKRNVYIQ